MTHIAQTTGCGKCSAHISAKFRPVTIPSFAERAWNNTAIKTISRLKREGLATGRPYRGIFLTDKGQKLATRVRARHRLVVDVLLALGVPAEAAEADAEGIEHYVSETTLEAFADFLRRRT